MCRTSLIQKQMIPWSNPQDFGYKIQVLFLSFDLQLRNEAMSKVNISRPLQSFGFSNNPWVRVNFYSFA
jgi:hypothetical protein